MSVLQSPDWFAIITDLIYAEIPMREISRRMDIKMSEALIRSYRSGVQPAYPRGEALLKLWSQATGKSIADIPRKPFIRGHRVKRRKL